MLIPYFAFRVLDEVIHSQDLLLDILGPQSRDSTLRVQVYYRALRDDLSATPGIYHTGETFGVPPASGDKGTYENLLNLLTKRAEGAIPSSCACIFRDMTASTSPQSGFALAVISSLSFDLSEGEYPTACPI